MAAQTTAGQTWLYLVGHVAKSGEGWGCSGQRMQRGTCSFPDVQHVANDLLGVLQGLFPGHLDGGCRDSLCPHALGRAGQPISPQHGEAGTGLRGARAVLGQALVDGFVCLVDPVDGESAVWGHERDKHHTDCHGPRGGSHGRASHGLYFHRNLSGSCELVLLGKEKPRRWMCHSLEPMTGQIVCLSLQILWFKARCGHRVGPAGSKAVDSGRSQPHYRASSVASASTHPNQL